MAEERHTTDPSGQTVPAPSMQSLKDAAEWLRVTLSCIGDGVITTDPHGKVTSVNPVAQALTGWTHEQAVGHPLENVFRIVNEETRAEVENPALRALRDGVIVGLANHTILIARDGTERPIDDSAAPIRNSSGEVHGAVLVFRDITERRQVEEKLRDSEVRYRRLFQTAKDGILILDAHTGKITDANAFMGGLVGQDAHEMLGKQLHEIGLFSDTEASKRAFKELQENGYLRYEHLPVKNQHGGTVEVEVIANLYKEDHTLVAQCNVRDISLRVAMEKKIKEQTEALAAESSRKDEFLAMLSHELLNPLAPIRSAVYLLKLHEPGTNNIIQTQARETIERQVVNLTKIVRDLLEVSRVVSGRIRLDFQAVDVNQVVRHAAETVMPLIEQRKHELVLGLSPDGLWVNADATRLEEVLVNLLNNAAKYTPDGGIIHVDSEQLVDDGRDQAVVRVRDNGVGIGPELLMAGGGGSARIFDLFTQANRSLARSAGGLGIGLSLAHRLVALHGGTIDARSAGLSKGSEFIVRLPLIPAPVPTVVPHPEPPPDAAAHKPVGVGGVGGVGAGRVLVVDDNIDHVLMLATTLRHKGYSVESAYNGTDGLRVALQWRPDVVLLDIGLPGLDGYEVARRLRADPAAKSVRLIAVTGYGRDSDLVLAKEAGFDAHMTKPIEFDDLEKQLAPDTPPPPAAGA